MKSLMKTAWTPKRKLLAASIGLLSLGLTGCELTAEELAALNDALFTNQPGGTAPDLGAPPPACFVERFSQPYAEVTRKIDILFVEDTSGSLDEERAAIADGIDAFVAALPVEADYRVGVMMGHSSLSAHSGRLYKAGSEPRVLDSSTQTLAEIRSGLRAKMTHTVDELASDGGEENFYSLVRGLDADKLADSRAAGFFRTDAALAVIFISDEQDICATFPAGVIPVVDVDNREGPAKARDCRRTVNGVEEVIGPTLVLQKLTALQGERPLVVSGIYYNRLGGFPVSGENEFGYGYDELVAMAHGVSVDLADGHYQNGLADIGTLATVRLNLITDYTLARPEVDPASIQVKVDAAAAMFDYNATLNSVHLPAPGHQLSVVDIHYCLRQAQGGTGGTPGSGGSSGSTGPTPGSGGGTGGSGGSGGTGGSGGGSGPGECTGLDCGVFGV